MPAKPSYEELERRVQALEKLVSEQSHSKKALPDSERLFKMLYENAPLGYQSLDENGHFIVVNQTWLDTLGYTREEVIGKSFADFLHPDWWDHFRENFPRFKAIGEILGNEFEMVKNNGDLILVAFNGKIGRDQDGNFLQTHCILDDITERRRIEKHLKESEEKFKFLMQQAPFVVEIYDLNGLQISVNKAYEELWDFPAETTLNKFNVLESKEVEETGLLEYVKRAYAGDSVDVPVYFFDPSGDTEAKGVGRRRWLNTRIYPLKDESGKVKNVVIVHQDITERKQAEEEYLKFFTITEKALLGSAIADPEGNLVYVNDYFAQIHGYTVKELIGRNLDIFHSDAQMPLVRKTIEDALEKGNIDALEIPHLHKNMHEFPMLMSLAVINDSLGKPKYIAATGFDLTEQKSAQKKLQNTVNDQNLMLNNDPTLIYFKDCYNNIIRVTESVAKATGLTREEIEGRPSKEIYPDMADKYWEDDLEVIKSGNPKHNIVEPLTGVDGSSHWLLTTKVPVKNDSGEIVGICVFATDITDLKNAELGLIAAKEKAEESEERFLLAMKASHDGLFDWNLETNEIYYSPAWKKILGYEDHELPNDFSIWENFTDPVDIKKSWEMQQKLISKKIDRFVLEFKMKHKNGHWVDILSRAEALFDDKGQAVRIIGTHTDITERKQAEGELRESHSMLTRTEQIANVGSWEWDIEADRVYWSNELFRIFQRDPAIGAPSFAEHSDIYVAEDMDRLRGAVEKCLFNGSPYELELRAIRSDGMIRQCIARGQAKYDGTGSIIRLVGSLQDITERKQAEEQLRKSEEQFRNLYDEAPVGYFEYDLQGNITRANHTYLKMLGYTAEEMLGQPCWKFIVDELAREQILAKLDGVRPPAVGLERIYRRKDGTTFSVLFEDRLLLDEEGHIKGIRTAIQDITERKDAEEEREKLQAQLTQAQKMESVGRLAGGVAHDFNNMLGVIFGHTEMALEDVDPAAPLYASLQAIQHAAERSAALTRQLLAFARKQTVAPKVVDINETVAGMLNMLRRLIGEDIDLLWCPGEDLPSVKIDPAQIDQLLANLCVNARDAIEGGGKITIETDRKTFDAAYCADHLGFLPGEYLLLTVSDDGCGIDQAVLNQIFEPFFTTKEQGKGTGLGLASVFGMVKQNNGYINVYSEPGQGTTFKIYLPAFASKSAWVAEKEPELLTEHGHETVLLVEDEPAILKMTTMMLTRLGYTVVPAATPGEAIRLALEYRGQIDLLMTDVVMPEMNGRELAGNLLSHYPDLKRLFMSGYTADVIAHHGVLDEGVHFIQKPFSMKDLGGKLRETLEG